MDVICRWQNALRFRNFSTRHVKRLKINSNSFCVQCIVRDEVVVSILSNESESSKNHVKDANLFFCIYSSLDNKIEILLVLVSKTYAGVNDSLIYFLAWETFGFVLRRPHKFFIIASWQQIMMIDCLAIECFLIWRIKLRHYEKFFPFRSLIKSRAMFLKLLTLFMFEDGIRDRPRTTFICERNSNFHMLKYQIDCKPNLM